MPNLPDRIQASDTKDERLRALHVNSVCTMPIGMVVSVHVAAYAIEHHHKHVAYLPMMAYRAARWWVPVAGLDFVLGTKFADPIIRRICNRRTTHRLRQHNDAIPLEFLDFDSTVWPLLVSCASIGRALRHVLVQNRISTFSRDNKTHRMNDNRGCSQGNAYLQYAITVDEQISRFDVSVQYPCRMQILETSENLIQKYFDVISG